MKRVRGTDIIKQKIKLDIDETLPRYKQTEIIANIMGPKANTTENDCPRAYGLSDPYTREKEYKMPGQNICFLFQFGSGCVGCWKVALNKTYTKGGVK